MNYYPGRIRELFLDPINVGELADADAVGIAGSVICGAALRLTLKFDPISNVITETAFKALGCGYLVASASVLTELLKGSTIYEASRLPSIMDSVLEDNLGAFPVERAHCASLCRDALGSAITTYLAASQLEWNGDEALICTCFGISESTIESAIKSGSLRTVEQVTASCNAGGGCGSCQPLIEDILDDSWRPSKFACGSDS